MQMKIKTIADRYFGTNSYIICEEQSGKCAVIDPAPHDVAEKVKELGFVPQFVLLTHGHFDHICGVDAFLAEYDVPVYIHEHDAEMLCDGFKNASALLMGRDVITDIMPKTLVDGEKISLGELCFDVVHTPGHTQGCVCYFLGDAVFTGDTLFAFDRGRTDLYGGSEQTIVESIQKLGPMLTGKTIYPGHGPTRKF